MQLPSSSTVEVGRLTRLFDKMSESYKLFWFQAILEETALGERTVRYERLVDRMIADAWYMVAEYKLNLGPSDNLERLILYAGAASGLRPAATRGEILSYLENARDRELAARKRKLIQDVPYRLHAPFLDGFAGKDWSVPAGALAGKLNEREHLIYYFGELSGLDRTITVRPQWAEYLTGNLDILRGWVRYHMIEYLQRRNPNVPGIVSKLSPPLERKLAKVGKYWRMIAGLKPLREIYTGEALTPRNISIDHFVPWSYVAHDEFWNLHPTTRSLNSRKSNGLPDWELYFPKLCEIEYLSYELIWEYSEVYREFEECRREHINSGDVLHRLYRRGLNRNEFSQGLEGILHPVYLSAQNIGFANWKWTEACAPPPASRDAGADR